MAATIAKRRNAELLGKTAIKITLRGITKAIGDVSDAAISGGQLGSGEGDPALIEPAGRRAAQVLFKAASDVGRGPVTDAG